MAAGIGFFAGVPQPHLKPVGVTYSAAIGACADGARWREALSLFTDMRRGRLQPNVVTYGAAISTCAKSFRWQVALNMLVGMHGRRLEPNVVTRSAAISVGQSPHPEPVGRKKIVFQIW